MGFTVLLTALIPNWEDSCTVREWHYWLRNSCTYYCYWSIQYSSYTTRRTELVRNILHPFLNSVPINDASFLSTSAGLSVTSTAFMEGNSQGRLHLLASSLRKFTSPSSSMALDTPMVPRCTDRCFQNSLDVEINDWGLKILCLCCVGFDLCNAALSWYSPIRNPPSFCVIWDYPSNHVAISGIVECWSCVIEGWS